MCSTAKVEHVVGLGARDVVDYTTTDYLAGDRTYDAILQLGGSRSARDFRRALTPSGRLMMIGGEGGSVVGPLGRYLVGMAMSPFVSQKVMAINAKATADDLTTLAEMLGDGTIRPLIGKTIPLSQVPAAVAEMKADHPLGKIVVDMTLG